MPTKKNRTKYQKEYYKNNIIHIKKNQKKYRKKNKNRLSEYKTKYVRIRRSTDLRFKIMGNLRTRIRTILIRRNASISTMGLIGCDIDYLIYHLQRRFKNRMNWDNREKWHIDHIVPCDNFNLNKLEEQLKCFHYTNLQPLWAIDNIRKHNKLPKKYKWTEEGWVFN